MSDKISNHEIISKNLAEWRNNAPKLEMKQKENILERLYHENEALRSPRIELLSIRLIEPEKNGDE